MLLMLLYEKSIIIFGKDMNHCLFQRNFSLKSAIHNVPFLCLLFFSVEHKTFMSSVINGK